MPPYIKYPSQGLATKVHSRAFVVLSFESYFGNFDRTIDLKPFFMGMDKHIKQKKKKNLKRKLRPSESAIDKGRVYIMPSL